MRLSTVAALLVILVVLLTLASGQRIPKPGNNKKRLRENNARREKNAVNKKNVVKKVATKVKKSIPANQGQANLEGCEEIFLPMCKGLVPYTHTKLPNQFNHTTQLEVYRHMEHLWGYLDNSCSRNLRLTACSMYLPKCQGKSLPLGPCKATCIRAQKKCADPLKEYMSLDWKSKFDCTRLPNKGCLKAVDDDDCAQEYPTCVPNSAIKICQGLRITTGIIPNMFGQCRVDEINTEIGQFDKLVDTNCHPALKFLLCGVYSPFCARPDAPFTFPCKEICEDVRKACEPQYKKLYNQLPWPNKLQCHRYPSGGRADSQCVMPTDPSPSF